MNEETPEVEKEVTVNDILGNFPNAPSEAQKENWKQKHGEIFCSGLTDTELFIWRTITRGEFVKMQTELSQVQVSSLEVEEKVVEKCMLWATDAGLMSLKNKAGTLSTLHEQVMQNSNFIDPRAASMLVVKL